MRPRVGVVADDITGAGDIGGLLALHGWAVRVLGAGVAPDDVPARLVGARADAVVLDTDSRFDPTDRAADKVRRATAALRVWGADLFYKKTCSVFRGNVGAEIDAMLDELGEPFTVAVAAFPRNGRQTLGGVHLVHGRPLAESELARDPVHPRTESNLIVDLQPQTARRVVSVALEDVRGDLAARLAALRAAGAG
ncbi:MAG TPA: four-carbon acid sugar kinase family protein, partial [Kofleriaceae bacterium]|nr:four-carbon acid sugar kinase family protein [Kofleriaceae bacterium]